ncbi:unnamed protein product [Sphenostylis stenocarpa]|uniref:Uncharacterized protein n=1 Tax=Sphenostylis stenocarpa TaxID=92480 RepID=A0AA86SAS8_9FABA|nr:unnamed protein product [Sphenostylis stenocarpa]
MNSLKYRKVPRQMVFIVFFINIGLWINNGLRRFCKLWYATKGKSGKEQSPGAAFSLSLLFLSGLIFCRFEKDVTWSKVTEIQIMNVFHFSSSIAWETDSHPCQFLFLFSEYFADAKPDESAELDHHVSYMSFFTILKSMCVGSPRPLPPLSKFYLLFSATLHFKTIYFEYFPSKVLIILSCD